MSDIVRMLDAVAKHDWRISKPDQISDTVARARDIIKELRAHRDGLNVDLAQAHLENEALRLRVERLEGALGDLISTTGLLYEHSQGCAVNHYGRDFDLHGFPGWLIDSRAAIDIARAVLAEGK